MEPDRLQYVLPPGMWKEAEEGAQKLLDALPKEDLLIDFVALMAALQAYVPHSEFPPIKLHGASSGTANRLVCAVKPGIAIVSIAEEGGHRLEEDVLERLGGRPGPRKVLETFVDGDSIIKTDGLTRNDGVLYHVDRKRPGQFANKLGAQISLLRDVVRGRTKHTNCEKGC